MNNRQIMLLSGALSGLISFLTFMIVHAITIMPIWFVFPLGIVLAVGGGMVVSRAYGEIKHRFPSPPVAVFAVILIVFTTLLPAFLLAQVSESVFTLDGTILVPVPVIVRRFITDLLFTSFAAGALIGWWLARSKKAALATGFAGIAFALGPGHNTAFLTIVPGVVRQLTKFGILTVVIVVTAAVVLVYAWELLQKFNTKTGNVDENLQTEAV